MNEKYMFEVRRVASHKSYNWYYRKLLPMLMKRYDIQFGYADRLVRDTLRKDIKKIMEDIESGRHKLMPIQSKLI